MNIQSLKLELVQQLVSTDDATVLTKVKRLLDLLRSQPGGQKAERDEELLAAANLFGTTAYSDDEPDIRGLKLKEPNPNYGG
ncbi:MAG: hypothetical protein KBF67_14510 [Flavobacteriales bacterium]|nr:hypothetical protein [Flavobacteriales bacterium]MBP9178699.1 hypothetical protein [Flavobacteriales bacterium]